MITVNGKTYNVTGNNISIRNGSVYVDKKLVTDVEGGITEIKFIGEVAKLETDCSVSCGRINGDVHAGGSVNCDDVSGDVNAGGSVNCEKVGGSVTAGGSIIHG